MRILGFIALLLMVPLVGGAGPYSIPWYSIDGGGGRSTGDQQIELLGVIGQPDAGILTGGEYTLLGGFLPPPIATVVAGDCDADGDADIDDYTQFQDVCFTGSQDAPGFPGLDPGCTCADLDNDGDVDLIDAGFFQDAFGG